MGLGKNDPRNKTGRGFGGSPVHNAPAPATNQTPRDQQRGKEYGEISDVVEGYGGLGKYYMRILLGEYKRPVPFQSAKWKPKTAIILPIPSELRDQTGVGYSNVNLETVGDLVNQSQNVGGAVGLRTVGQAVDATGRIGLSMGEHIVGALAKSRVASTLLGGIASEASQIIGSLFNADQITSAIQQSQGIAPNPNPSVLFQGPILRDFAFSWAFYPKNKTESKNIQRLIQKLKANALPSVNIANDAALLNYPSMCQLNFFPWDNGGEGEWGWNKTNSIIRFKRCVIQDVSVSYNPFGTPAFFEETNLPTSYQLTISFKEIEYMLSEDWGGDRPENRHLDNTIAVFGETLAKPLEFGRNIVGVIASEQPGGAT